MQREEEMGKEVDMSKHIEGHRMLFVVIFTEGH